MYTTDGYESINPIDVMKNDYTKINYGKLLEKLGAYEDAEEQGLLIRLPCDIGDTIYIVGMLGCAEIEEWEITDITMHRSNCREPYFHAVLKKAKGNTCSFWLNEFGRGVFTSKAEAEQALAKMKGE